MKWFVGVIGGVIWRSCPWLDLYLLILPLIGLLSLNLASHWLILSLPPLPLTFTPLFTSKLLPFPYSLTSYVKPPRIFLYYFSGYNSSCVWRLTFISLYIFLSFFFSKFKYVFWVIFDAYLDINCEIILIINFSIGNWLKLGLI